MMPPAIHAKRLLRISVLVLLTASWPARGDFPAPPPPKEYEVQIRYQIYASRNERIAQFQDMVRYLESIGFHKRPAPDPEAELLDPNQTRMSGTIASGQVPQIFLDRRVKSLLLVPAGFKLPEDLQKPVKVQLQLAAGLPLDRQRLLADQVRDRLRLLGFREAIGYDHRGHTRLVGWIATGNLPILLKDLRWQPTDWLTPEVPLADVPSPLRDRSPILITEVLAEPEGAPSQAPEPPALRPDDNSQKISPDLRQLFSQEEAGKAIRMQVILTFIPEEFDENWRRELVQASPGIIIEGRLGSVVTVVGPPKLATALSASSMVSAIRLSPQPMSSLRSATVPDADNQAALQFAGLSRYHAQGKKGQGVRVAVIDGDFRGFEKLKGKSLPAKTTYVDFTAERNPTLLPDPFSGDPQGIGSGTQFAQALVLAAPDAEVTLIRVDPTCPYQVVAAARLIRGDALRSDSLVQRDAELNFEIAHLRTRREDLRQERKAVLDDFRQDEEHLERRNGYFKKLAELEEQERAYHQKLQRFIKIIEDERALKGILIVACSLVWNDGYPLGGASPLSRFFNDTPYPALWYEPAGNQRGQAWAGLFHDADGNGVMEFAPLSAPLPSQRWTPELNFLAWQPFAKDRALDLPAKAQVRISIQWREVHEREFAQRGDDVYREPLAKLNLLVLRQRDPSGAKLPADDMELVARSPGLPLRIQNLPDSATYEQIVEFSVPTTGRYALQVEGQVHPGIRPASAPTLPGIEKNWELQPRIFVEVVDESSRLAGRPVWLDYATDLGTIGVPGDAHGLITVGAADNSGKPEVFSSPGPPVYLELLIKPDVLASGRLRAETGGGPVAYGTGLATAFAAGQAAILLNSGMPLHQVDAIFHWQQGKFLRLP
jgi:hypothetical protein